MGAYLTQTGGSGATGDLTNAIGNQRLALICPHVSNGTVGTAAVDFVILNAEAEVNSILGPAFTVPQTGTIAQVIKRCTIDIAVHYGYKRSPEMRDAEGRTVVWRDYDDAREALKAIRTGDRDMGNETTKSALVSAVVYKSTQTFIVDASESTRAPTGGF